MVSFSIFAATTVVTLLDKFSLLRRCTLEKRIKSLLVILLERCSSWLQHMDIEIITTAW